MLYTPLKHLARLSIGINFKKVHLVNLEKLPLDKPVLLVTNHPTAFIEPCIFGSYLTKPVNYLVRGDMFSKPLFARFMRDIHLIPIFRRTEGYDNLKNNYDTFDYVYQLLKDGSLVHILAEASTQQVKRLRPLKKGTARMAFGALEKHGKDQDILLVPCGVNYTAADEYRSDVLAVFGDPIPIQDYIAQHDENEARAIKQLTNRLQDDLKKLIIHVNDEEEEVYEYLFEMDRNDNLEPIFPIFDKSKRGLARFQRENDIAEQLNQAEPEAFSSIKSKVFDYKKACEEHNVTDFGVRRNSFGDFSNILILALGFIPFLIGRYGCFIPIYAANRFAIKKIKQREFVASVKLASGIGFSFFYYLALLILAFFFMSWPVLVIVLLLPLLGYFSVVYQEFYAHYKQARQFLKLPTESQDKLTQMRSKLSHQNEIVLSQD